MPITPINVGTAPQGTDGDTTRAAFTAVNANFEVLNRIEIMVALSDEDSILTVGTNVASVRVPTAFTLTEVRINVRQAPWGSNITVDIRLNGTSLVSSRPRIDIGNTSSVSGSNPGTISTSTMPDDGEISFDIDQVGTTTPGTGLKATLIGYRT